MTKGEFLEKIMILKGFKFPALSKASGVPYTTIKSMFERNLEKASVDNAIKICKVLGVSVEWIYEKEFFTDEDLNLVLGYDAKNSPKIKVLQLPLFGSVAAGALAVIEGVTASNVEQITIAPEFLGKYADCDTLFAMRVNGDSMNKIARDNEIIIAKEQNEFKAGDIVIFSHNGEYSLKRYAPHEVEGYILFKAESYDPSFKDIAIPVDTDGDLKIIGKVIFCGKLF